jgi:ribosomal peptide maturation radical SAM protein 1
MGQKDSSRATRRKKDGTVICDVGLVSMPFKDLRHPPIQLGLLQRSLELKGISAHSHSFELSFADYMHARADQLEMDAGKVVDSYLQIASKDFIVQLGDWIFCVPPFRDAATDDQAYFQIARDAGVSEDSIRAAQKLRTCVPGFLHQCADEVLRGRPRIVGFSTVFQQNVASLALARILKTRNPDVTIVFGGGNCAGPMGSALHASFPWVDFVVRGEGEQAIVAIAEDVLAGRPARPRPGLCYRQNGQSVAVSIATAPQVPMEEVPTPIYDDYFARLERSPLKHELLPEVAILFESSRGCWWGEKSHCTFCGLNSELMVFRSKSPEAVVKELVDFAARYHIMDFVAVDDIIDLKHIRTLLPLVRQTGFDFTLFYETKSNLSKNQLRAMKLAGVDSIQPGVESLSTPILRLMRKGVSAWMNVRLLKWCAELEISPAWNLLYGFPGEPADEYEEMARLVPALVHLKPPGFMPIQIQRFSPYFERTADFPLKLVGPERYYHHIYELPEETLWDLAYDFEHAYTDQREPHQYTQKLAEAVNRWRELPDSARCSLYYRQGPGFLSVVDRRPGFEAADYLFEGAEAVAYLCCDSGATIAAVLQALRDNGFEDYDAAELKSYLDELAELKLLMREGGIYLSLAIKIKALDGLSAAETETSSHQTLFQKGIPYGEGEKRRA